MRATALAALLCCSMLATGCSTAMRGSMALSNGDTTQALALYQQALEKEPDSLYLRQRIGLTYFAMKDYASAEATFQDILTRAPGEPEATFYLGLSRIGKGEREQGLDMLEKLHWPYKYLQQKAVREEAQRLRKHPEMSPAEIFQAMQDALAAGIQEQHKYDIENGFS